MIIIGLDPGIARTGFGIINTTQALPFITCGCLTTPAHQNLENRLVIIGNDLEELIKKYQPQAALVEQIFFGTNKTTAMTTAATRGVILYILRRYDIAVHTLTPLQIKSRLTGHGRATKHQIQTIVTKRLHLTTLPEPDDAADALAGALCLADSGLIL